MRRSTGQSVHSVPSAPRRLVGGLLLLLALAAGCQEDGKLEPAACDALESQAYDLLNDRHLCGGDADCSVCEWPNASRAISKADMDKIRPLKKQFDDGKCPSSAAPPAAPPDVYCKEGLCVVRHKAADAGSP